MFEEDLGAHPNRVGAFLVSARFCKGWRRQWLPNGQNSEGARPRRPKNTWHVQGGTTQAKAAMTQNKLCNTVAT